MAADTFRAHKHTDTEQGGEQEKEKEKETVASQGQLRAPWQFVLDRSRPTKPAIQHKSQLKRARAGGRVTEAAGYWDVKMARVRSPKESDLKQKNETSRSHHRHTVYT